MAETTTNRGKVIVFGIAFFYPLAGVTFQFLHYLLGLKRLGYDVYYVEDSQRRVYDPTINDMTEDASRNVASVSRVLDRFGFENRWVYRSHYGSRPCYGMTESQLLELYRDADAFLNVTGGQEIRDEHRDIPRRLYVESDPFAAQVRVAQGDPYWIDLLDAHTHHFTFGENLGESDCPVPIERFTWLPTRQPVVLDLWNNETVGGSVYRTIATWSNKGNDVEWNGETYYWTKNFALERMMELPRRRRNLHFGIAVKAESSILQRFTVGGWTLYDPIEVSSDIDTYRRFIQKSRGEFTVARDQYVRGRTGWQSDRSVSYLAAGRPVITEDTGFGKFVPTGEGLFAYQQPEDVLAALDTIESDYAKHCSAARGIAHEYFAAEKVLAYLMDRAVHDHVVH